MIGNILGFIAKLVIVFNINNNSIIIDRISYVESRHDSNAIGDKNTNKRAIGICQITIETATFTINRLMDDNIVKTYIKDIIRRHGITKALLNANINKYLCLVYLRFLSRSGRKTLKNTIISYNTGLHAKRRVKNGSGAVYWKKIIKGINKDCIIIGFKYKCSDHNNCI